MILLLLHTTNTNPIQILKMEYPLWDFEFARVEDTTPCWLHVWIVFANPINLTCAIARWISQWIHWIVVWLWQQRLYFYRTLCVVVVFGPPLFSLLAMLLDKENKWSDYFYAASPSIIAAFVCEFPSFLIYQVRQA